MERSVVHHNHSSFGKCWKQEILEPILKQFVVHRSTILTGSDDLIAHLSRYDACTRIFASPDPIMNQLSLRTVAVLPVNIAIDSCFVYICYIFWRNIGNFVLVFGYFIVILFYVCGGLFFVLSSTASMPSGQPIGSSRIPEQFLSDTHLDVRSHTLLIFPGLFSSNRVWALWVPSLPSRLIAFPIFGSLRLTP